MRTIHADIITELAKPRFVLAHLVQINFDTPVYLTDHAHNLTINGQIYRATGHLLGLSEVTESAELRVSSFNITLSGVDQTYIAVLLTQPSTNRQVIINNVLLNAAGDIIGDPILYYQGRISEFNISDQAGSATINLTSTSHWANFEKKSGRRTNDASQQALFDGDKFNQYASHSVTNIKWGRT